jgi:hypothetical protein
LVRIPEGKRPLGKPKIIWEDNIKMDVKDIRWEVWTALSWLRI